MNQALRRCYVFGDFRLDGAERRLLRGGTPIPLPPKIFDTLLLLVENADHLVEKDEFMKQLWPGIYVGEDALARNISILRRTLGESSDSQSFIATIPTRGYRFVAPVQKVNGTEPQPQEKQPADSTGFLAESASAKEAPESKELAREDGRNIRDGNAVIGQDSQAQEATGLRAWPRRIAYAALIVAAGAAAGFVTYYLLSPAPVPRVLRTVQLTHSGRVDPWTSLVSDGSRIYFSERAGDHWNLAQTSVGGGDSQVIAAPFQNTVVLGVSPDHANLLIGTFEHRFAPMPLWIWPVQGGAPRRIGDITAYDAAWCPNGREIIYAEDDGAYIANSDGSNVRKFIPWQGRTGWFSWSPDSHFLRFSASVAGLTGPALFEVHSDGSSLRHLIPDWNKLPDECCGAWTADGKYFLFHSKHSGTLDVWAIQEKSSLLRRRLADPIRLTSGPTDFWAPLVSSDGHKVFVYGANGQSDYVRFDLRFRQFLPVFPNLLAYDLAFSRDGEWLAYASHPDHSLVRMRPDGTQRLAIVSPSFEADAPRWSPDGKQIVFDGRRPDRTMTLFVVSPDGGVPRELIPYDQAQFDPAWSPDGKLLALTREERVSSNDQVSTAIYLFDLSTNQVTLLEGSQGLRAPSWSPDSRFIAAKSEDDHRLMLFDCQTSRWTQLARGNLLGGSLWWSKDGKAIYYQDLLAPNEPVYCFHLNNKKQEVVVSFEQFLRGNVHRAGFLGFAPDGSILAVLSRSNSDIYALELELP